VETLRQYTQKLSLGGLLAASLSAFANGAKPPSPPRNPLPAPKVDSAYAFVRSLPPIPTRISEADARARMTTWSANDAMAPFHGEDGCWARAQKIATTLGSDIARKVWIYPTTPGAIGVSDTRFLGDGETRAEWSYHVAVIVTIAEEEGGGVRVLDPALGIDRGPLTVDEWLKLFVFQEKNIQFISSPAMIPANFKYWLCQGQNRWQNCESALDTTDKPDDQAGLFQDPFGDWHGVQWSHMVWKAWPADNSSIQSELERENEMPESYVKESQRRRERNVHLSLNLPRSSGERRGIAPRTQIIRDRIASVTEHSGETWVSFERNSRWVRVGQELRDTLKSLTGSFVSVEVSKSGEILNLR